MIDNQAKQYLIDYVAELKRLRKESFGALCLVLDKDNDDDISKDILQRRINSCTGKIRDVNRYIKVKNK